MWKEMMVLTCARIEIEHVILLTGNEQSLYQSTQLRVDETFGLSSSSRRA